MEKIYNFLVALILAAILVALFPIKSDANSLSGDIVTENDPIPLDVRIACDVWGAHYNICPELLEAIAYHESRYDANAVNGTCKGLMQINTTAHQDRITRLGVSDLMDANQNVKVAADYLAELFAEHEDVCIVLGLYHGESGAIGRANNGNLSSYVCAILEKSEQLERSHGK